MRQPILQSPKQELVRANAKLNRSPDIIPGARAASQINAAAVRYEPRLDLCAGGAENNWIISKIGVHISQRRQQTREKLIARPIGLFHGQLAPEIGLRSHSFFER